MKRKVAAFFLTLGLTSLFGCGSVNTVLSESSFEDDQITADVSTEGITTELTQSSNELTYSIFEGMNHKEVCLPIDLDSYLSGTDNKEFQMEKMLSDFGWQEYDENGDGKFSLNYWIPEEFDIRTQGDYYYYDCGDMWVRLSIVYESLDFAGKDYAVPYAIDYSFIQPDSTGSDYYEFSEDASPTNSFDVFFHDLGEEDAYLLDYDEKILMKYDYVVFFAYIISWTDISPTESPLYYFGRYNQYDYTWQEYKQRDHLEV